MPTSKIVIRGAREHNLRNIDVELPRNRFIVITGVSGSGKSIAGLRHLYAEGQRRTSSPSRPTPGSSWTRCRSRTWTHIEGLSPAIAIEQRSAVRNPRSTVATTTEIYDYLRVLLCPRGHAALPALRPAHLRARASARSWTRSWACRDGAA